MQTEEPLELERLLVQKSRRELIPFWIKIFIWIFIVFALFVPLLIIIRLSGRETLLTIYGLETNDAFSSIGIIISALFFLKGIAAFGMWSEKEWAIKLAIIDSVIGIIICLAVMTAPVFSNRLIYNYRLELILLIPYLIWLFKIKAAWESNDEY